MGSEMCIRDRSYLAKKLRVDHKFSLPYCPWSNGTVDVVCRELVRSTRALLSEAQLARKEWPTVVPIVQAALNSTPSKRINGRCPLTVFSGLASDNPISVAVRKSENASLVKSISEERAKVLMDIDKFHKALDEMHKDVSEASSQSRRAAVDSHNRKTGVRPINFSEGDFVLKGNPLKNIPRPSL